jgi:hypothetical protein
LQKSRFPGSVDSDDAGALAGGQLPGHLVEEGPLAVAHRRVEQVDDVLAQAPGREPDEFDPVARWRLVLDEGVGGIDAELRLGRAGGCPAAQPGEFLAQQVVAALGRHRCHTRALGLGQHVCRVAAVVAVDGAAVDLPGEGGHGVEEPPVVGDGDERRVRTGAAGRQVLGEPGHPLDVEMVGGLVEQQQVGVGHEQCGQRETPSLATRQGSDEGIRTADGEHAHPTEQTVEDLPDPGVTSPLVLGTITDQGVPDGRGGVEPVVLGQQADGEPADRGDPSGVGLLTACEHPQQRRLAATVAPDDPDPLSTEHADGEGIEDVRNAVDDGDAFK